MRIPISPKKDTSLPVGDEKTRVVRTMFDKIAPKYEFVNKIMTFGMDGRWRRNTVKKLYLPPKSIVLDIASGTGDLTRESLKQKNEVISTDLSFGMLAVGHGMPKRIQSDAAFLPFKSAFFDGITCGYALRNFTHLEQAIQEMARVLKPGGRISILEIAEPTNPVWRFGFRMWFRKIVPVVGSIFSDRDAYTYLPKSTVYLPPKYELVTLFRKSGFVAVNHQFVMGGLSQIITATRSI